jgi:amino acid transporter
MKEKILEQITRELKVAAWVDLVVMVVGVAVTLIFFGIAAASAGSTTESASLNLSGGILGGGGITRSYAFHITPTIIMAVALIVIVIINWYGIKMLRKNKAERAKLNEGLTKLLKDETLDQYHDGSVYRSYETRYSLFTVIMGAVAALSVIVPLVVFIDQLTKL